MNADLVLLLVLATFIVLVSMEVPIGFATAIAGVGGIALIGSHDLAAQVVRSTPYTSTAKYGLFVIPMYILLGAIIANVGIGAKIYTVVNRLLRRMPAGLPSAAVFATAIFSGISGSSAADVATFGRISVTEMTKHGYDSRYASAVVAAAGTFAVLIPPSITLVLYGIIAGESIGALIIAGIIPGALSALALVAFLVGSTILRRNSAAAESLVGSVEVLSTAASSANRSPSSVARRFSIRSVPWSTASGLLYAALLFAIVLGGVYTGVFTATEAGAVGAFVAAIIGLAIRLPTGTRRRTIFSAALRETADVTSMIFLLIVGGALFTSFLVYARFPARVSEWALSLPIPPKATILVFLIIVLVLGMFLDGLSILLLTVPIAAPVVTAMGFDGVWFGILIVKGIEIGLITPPVGINVYIIAGIMGQPVEDVFRRVLPFVILDLVVTGAFFMFPQIVLWLPEQAGLL